MENAINQNALLHLILLAAVCAVVFLLFLDRTPFHDKGEPREALVVRDIVLEGRWLLPLRAGEHIASKPPLFHWFAAGASILRGEMTEASIRFPSALFGTLGVFLCYFFGRRLYDPKTGLWAGLILATTALYYAVGTEARVDMTLVFFVTLTLVLFFSIYRGFLHGIWWYVFFMIAGASVTAKGPVSIVLCALVVTTFLMLRKRWDIFRTMLCHPGLVLGMILSVAWYAAALYLGGDQFFNLQFIKENFARYFVHGEGGTGHQKPIYYFVPYLFTLGMPWTLFLPGVIWSYFTEHLRLREDLLFLGLWAATVFVFFSLSAGKRPPYILPLYPPVALLIALWLRDQSFGSFWKATYFKSVAIFASLTGAVLGAGLVIYSMRLDVASMLLSLGVAAQKDVSADISGLLNTVSDIGWLVPVSFAAAMVLWFSVALSLHRCRIDSAVAQMVLVSVLSIAFVRSLVLPNLAKTESYKEFMQSATAAAANGQSLILFPRDIDPSSIVFYGKSKVEILPDDVAVLQKKLTQSKDYIIVEEDIWNTQIAGASQVPVLDRSRGAGSDGDARLVLVRGQGT
ncbi:MAG TPA: glycosyltransferase family 39 protein [Candidatus Polarisedimenticolaceae bacterium]|nr:glycosyltransferase family 39 protein [Candidatus Polarisedimenticolaceae bacterium]